jgi:hypothetical protein
MALLTAETGFPKGALLPELHELVLNQVIPFAEENDILVTIPTGNNAPDSLATITPQLLGTTDNGLITVAGVEKDGSLYTDSNPDLGTGGSISIYAPARDVLAASIESDTATTMITGTSLAAPAVAGASAYFSLSELDANWPEGKVARATKQFFFLSARIQRSNNPVPDNLGYAGPAPRSVVVACKSLLANPFYVEPFSSDSEEESLNTNTITGNRQNSLSGCGVAVAKVKRQDDLPDLSCPSSSAGTSMTTMTLDPTTTETSSTTSDWATSETPTTTEATTTTSQSYCTVVYGDGSSCIQVPSNSCAFGSQVICPLAKRGLHEATATTYYATGSFIKAVPTAA